MEEALADTSDRPLKDKLSIIHTVEKKGSDFQFKTVERNNTTLHQQQER